MYGPQALPGTGPLCGLARDRRLANWRLKGIIASFLSSCYVHCPLANCPLPPTTAMCAPLQPFCSLELYKVVPICWPVSTQILAHILAHNPQFSGGASSPVLKYRSQQPWIQRPLDSPNFGFNDITFNNPLIQQTRIQYSLNSTILDSTILGFKSPWIQQPHNQQSLTQQSSR